MDYEVGVWLKEPDQVSVRFPAGFVKRAHFPTQQQAAKRALDAYAVVVKNGDDVVVAG
ncbi:cobalt-precorrin-5B (C(1))-methyltransferase [Spirosoma agri]|uniref:Cobalt-precorrin-5B (C(1))-methyltransferase n=1 Tax=Spirosoma agri TaxID=1987381 RepID=A0A6M0IJ15_9BACT|nr:cobalt-precorrin-5B (C(1))-methyltransferase [Spirosoma agri]NEU68280.1 cobalt-precorrin-5B (C(1))-methyltransferase [Spirosoma agri]